MKKLLPLLVLSLLALSRPAEAVTVSINQFVEHPSLDEAVRGFKDALAGEGFPDVTYLTHNAQANMPTVLQIVSQIQGEKPDLVLTVATPSAQATAQKIKDIPVLFTAVTDPVSAGLVDSLEKPGHNVTGTTDMSPIEAQVALIREIHPQARNLGVLYNAGEANSVVQVALLKAAAAKHGFELKEAVTVNTAGVYQAAKSLVGGVDLIYLPTDNTVISSMDSVIKVCVENKIPLYPGEADSVRKGGVAALALSYYELGRQTGVQAARILRGEAKPADLPVETQKDTALVINLKIADRMGAAIPQAVLKRAQEIIR
ncbi:MAG: ABC transporter substrate-binding protein [Candidatus Adiutrix sp.]|jgi:putative ABC transport system substrate-binding protein|nr:ABC transporter substrate-binding protein [Candidatus Adiutrix sp.]